MRYYKNLYLSDGLEKKKDKIIKKLDNKKLQRELFLLVLPQGKENQLEIIEAKYLLQPGMSIECMFVVGIAKTYFEALDMVENISKKVYDETKGLNIREYITKKEQET